MNPFAGKSVAGKSIVGDPAGSGHAMPAPPVQLLSRDAYTSPAWFERERRDLFGRSWACAGAAIDLSALGDYATVAAGDRPLVVLRDDSGELRAFHNLCRHRGTELLEGAGRLDRPRIVCPYHRWTYGLDGALRAVPLQAQCFPGLDTAEYPLFPAAVGELGGLVFAHPDPRADFADWRSDLDRTVWPHRFERMSAGPETTWEMNCNWKVFVENAIDGYHLAYLHRETLGGPRADRNVWDVHGRHLVWYSTETGRKTCMPETVAKAAAGWAAPPVEGAGSGHYGGVYLLFPNTIVTATPTELTVSRLEAVSAGISRLSLRAWTRKGAGWSKWFDREEVEDAPGYDPSGGCFRLSHLECHPLETGDFHWEDVWICEKMQRSLNSPMYRVGRLAAGAGAEAPLEVFQRNVLDFMAPGTNSTAPRTDAPAARDAIGLR